MNRLVLIFKLAGNTFSWRIWKEREKGEGGSFQATRGKKEPNKQDNVKSKSTEYKLNLKNVL